MFNTIPQGDSCEDTSKSQSSEFVPPKCGAAKARAKPEAESAPHEASTKTLLWALAAYGMVRPLYAKQQCHVCKYPMTHEPSFYCTDCAKLVHIRFLAEGQPLKLPENYKQAKVPLKLKMCRGCGPH